MKLRISVFVLLFIAGATICAQSVSASAPPGRLNSPTTVAEGNHSDHAVGSAVDSLTRYVDQIFTSQELLKTLDKLYATVTDAYGTHNLMMDIYSPPASDSVSRRPVIVWMHGGFFSGGSRQDFAAYSIEFARRGYVVATIDYRLLKAYNPSASTNDAVHMAQADAESAIDYLRANAATYRIDPNTIIIGGWSAGSSTSWRVGYDYEYTGHASPVVRGAIPIDAENLKPSDFSVGDPPWIWIQRGQPTDEVPGPYIAKSDSLGIPNQLSVIPGTSHTDLVSAAYTPSISVTIARFLADHVLLIPVTSATRQTEMPLMYSLEQNYPNPFNPSTVIRYYLPALSTVTLKVYNVLGQELNNLISGIQSNGYQTVTWDSRNTKGELMPSGVYLYRLEAKSADAVAVKFTQVRKMILMQ